MVSFIFTIKWLKIYSLELVDFLGNQLAMSRSMGWGSFNDVKGDRMDGGWGFVKFLCLEAADI